MTSPYAEPAEIDFQGKHFGEEFQFYTRQHWIRLVGPFCRLLIWSGLLIGIWHITFNVVGIEDTVARESLAALLGFFFFLAHFEFLDRFYRYFLYVIVVTDKKIHRIKKGLIACDDHQSIDLWMLQDIHKCQHGVIQNLLRFGSIILEAQETVLRIHFLPHIAQKYRDLMHLRERARQRMTYPAQKRSESLDKKEVAVPSYDAWTPSAPTLQALQEV